MIKVNFIILFFFFIFNSCFASTKLEVLNNLKTTNNITFDFEQIINGNKQFGDCIIEYPKKIFCSYKKKIDKILISDGISLVIKNISSNQLYFYPLKKTPFELLLDKNFLIEEIKNSERKFNKDNIYSFSIKKENISLTLFFDNKNYNIVGWETEDIYQNKIVTNLFNLKRNQKIDKNIFQISNVD